jgi:nucleoid DNA-binding protein
MKKQGAEFDRGDLARHLADDTVIVDATDYTQLSEAEYVQILNNISRALPDALVEFGRVEIHGLGVFALELRQPDSGKLPDGTPWTTPERYKVVFRPSEAFVQIIASRTGMPTY